ncbi:MULTISPECIES: DUF6545 domain-containing protein [unclassified Micromonospora]|uniref:DUF6545 domain-containing protein n=1 Tax=unclassified Micromonospora TaxID=2617518 RepID=UPI001C23D1F1|nr:MULTISPECIES: DUF6545 domain-containing protein [unclassified Micromonospora]MBU8857811.1 ImmA/IrrE family metallo-endopeptidase [Micromonospora sp. WMMB482]MDM4783442.1 ImmA/IrrE family metallo-endopeptidase [Micromonospora sp. b486]
MLLARARLRRRLARAGLPDPCPPYTVDAWCAAIGAARRQNLVVGDVDLEAGHPPGVLITDRPEGDVILVDRSLPPVTRTQTVLHELAHLVLEHPGDIWHDGVDRVVEAEAELAADLLYQQLTRAAAHDDADSDQLTDHPGWLPQVTTNWWAERRSDWHLLHLWMTLRDSMPQLAIVTTSTATPVPTEIGGNRQRHRTVVEIHEVLRALRPWCSTQVHASATAHARRHRLDAASTDAVAEAATIAVALRHRQLATAPPASGSQPPPPRHNRHDVRAEARHLARVDQAMSDSPLVAAEIARWAPVDPAALSQSRTYHLTGGSSIVPPPADLPPAARSAQPV